MNELVAETFGLITERKSSVSGWILIYTIDEWDTLLEKENLLSSQSAFEFDRTAPYRLLIA
jgi:hypothetical protein